MKFIVLLLIFIVIVLCTRLYFINRNIKHLAGDINSKKVSQSNVLTTSSTNNKAIKLLVTEVNLIFDLLFESHNSEIKERESFQRALHNITHDIRTPLTISLGYVQQLLQEPDQEITILKKIESNLKLVSKRLEVLLEFQSVLEKQDLELETINLTSSLTNILLKYYDQLNQNHFEVDINLPDDPIFINGNLPAIERIMQNILGNVLKHGRDTLLIKLENNNSQIKLTVKNKTQHPIHQVDRLIDRFYYENFSQLESSSGLGLYIVNEIVESMNGDLNLSYTEPYFTLVLEWYKK